MCDQIVRDVSDAVVDNIGTFPLGAPRRMVTDRLFSGPDSIFVACLYNATEAVCRELGLNKVALSYRHHLGSLDCQD